MMEKCFDEGTIQAFLDGELASDLAENVACHVALCDNCAAAMALAEEENSFAFAALETEFNALVPTERIRTRLFETISAEKKTFWQKIFGKGFRWTSPNIAAFASLIFVVTAFAVLLGVRENAPVGGNLARNNPPEKAPVSPVTATQIPEISGAGNPIEEQKTDVYIADVPPVNSPVRRAAYQPRNDVRIQAQRAVYRPNNSAQTAPYAPVDIPKPANDYAISGEETYIRTIATLKQTVDNRKDEIMRPSARVAFEKDLAVVNDAIDKMRKEVRRNPKNEVAKEVLRASYQNKIDLLNSVAEKNELIASLK